MTFSSDCSATENTKVSKINYCIPEQQEEQCTDEGEIDSELVNNVIIAEQLSVQQSEKEDFFELLCKITYAEGGLEDENGQVAVAATILNRLDNNSFPETLEDVINQKGAFSSVHDGEIYIMCEEPYVVEYENIPDITKTAVERAINGEDPTEELLQGEAQRLGLDKKEFVNGGALFFYNPYACGEDALKEREKIQVKIKIGKHIFYKVWG